MACKVEVAVQAVGTAEAAPEAVEESLEVWAAAAAAHRATERQAVPEGMVAERVEAVRVAARGAGAVAPVG